MSLLMLLGGDVEPQPPGTDWPATSDPILLAMRPAGRVVSSGVASDTASFDLIANATANAVMAEGQSGYLAWNYAGPDYRTTVFMQPGSDYPGGGAYDWRALVGTNPEDRSVSKRRDNSGGVVHSFGSIYMENLRLVPQTTDDKSAPKYPWHITGGKMCIAANCAFDLSEIAADTIEGGDGIAGWVGADGDSGMTIVLYECDFIPGPKANGLNIHDGGPPDHPMTLILVGCTGLENVELFCPGGPSADGQPNRMYVIDTPVAALGADSDGEVFTNGAAPAMSGSTGTIHRGETSWPVPQGGLSDLWADHYYPSSIGSDYTYVPPVDDAALFEPVAGRTYYTRVRPDRAARYTHSGVAVAAADGLWASRLQPADTEYVRDEPPVIESLNANEVLTLGVSQRPGYYAYSRYPGDNGFWVSTKASSADARLVGSTQLSSMTDCYYTDDGVTLILVAPETPHPLPLIGAGPISYVLPPLEPEVSYDSVYGNSPPGGSYSVENDGSNIRLAQNFSHSGATGAIAGGRVWLPSVPPGATGLRVMLWLGSINQAPLRSVDIADLRTGWNDAVFGESVALPSAGQSWRIGYEFLGDRGLYVYSGNFRSGAFAVESSGGLLNITAGVSRFVDGGSEGSASSATVGYGIDVLVEP